MILKPHFDQHNGNVHVLVYHYQRDTLPNKYWFLGNKALAFVEGIDGRLEGISCSLLSSGYVLFSREQPVCMSLSCTFCYFLSGGLAWCLDSRSTLGPWEILKITADNGTVETQEAGPQRLWWLRNLGTCPQAPFIWKKKYSRLLLLLLATKCQA